MNHLVCACKKCAAQSYLLFHWKNPTFFEISYKACCIVAAMKVAFIRSHLSFCTLFIRDLILIYLIATQKDACCKRWKKYFGREEWKKNTVRRKIMSPIITSGMFFEPAALAIILSAALKISPTTFLFRPFSSRFLSSRIFLLLSSRSCPFFTPPPPLQLFPIY